MKKIIITMFAAAAISFSYLRHRNMDLAQLTDLQLANIEALANTEGDKPVKIPCSEKENAECKFLTEGSDGIWRHIIIKDMTKSQ
ncbi:MULTISPECIES: NVEALA domain-containing protein [Bacteroides]|jgi:hypothetical protein|uniref:NVEALA domain-containing protein n=2 Tax=Bacteroides TaxID=816 RepID=A0A9X2NYP7_9BACE|nr:MULTISPECIES: NVEALA domain-containing protein [Bacteroides]MCR6504983.1 NVEALA domain-containing protein [Bacteroides muris (ex Fokt et al. 2023)]MCR6508505.1 NVEALA domain-containing protein [Bacteroides muris (ex Fokt et al. 2023)]TGY07173.1 hypothetical protein E5355_06985 [Bacteroides muris (ex Afrizal et al. 2022)]